MNHSAAIMALVLMTGVGFSASSLADGSGLAALETDLSLQIEVDAPGLPGLFAIVKSEPAAAAAVTYAVGSGAVEFNISDRVADSLDNPLFCFDFSEGNNSQIRLEVESVGGQTALPAIAKTVPLQYGVSNQGILFSPPALVQCFYYGLGGGAQFGLYGRAPASRDAGNGGPEHDRIFENRFEVFSDLHIHYDPEFLPDSIAVGDTLTYQLVVSNPGDAVLHSVSFQEVFPADSDVYPVALDAGSWDCDACPTDLQSGQGEIRFAEQTLAPGEEWRFEVERPVLTASTSDGVLRLHAGVVDGPGSTALFDADVVEIPIVGEPVRLVFVSDDEPVVLGGTKQLVIQVQDSKGLLVANDSRFLDVVLVVNQSTGNVTGLGAIGLTNGTATLDVTGSALGLVSLRVTDNPSTLQPGLTQFSVVSD